eukprot:8964451-Pyramimonas_sp.AAC.1
MIIIIISIIRHHISYHHHHTIIIVTIITSSITIAISFISIISIITSICAPPSLASSSSSSSSPPPPPVLSSSLPLLPTSSWHRAHPSHRPALKCSRASAVIQRHWELSTGKRCCGRISCAKQAGSPARERARASAVVQMR